MSYRDLEIRQLARELTVDIHKMTLTKLPKIDIHEEGAQIRRAVKSIKSNIVEGYGRRRYKPDDLKFLTCAHASCDETIDHLETLHETGCLTDKETCRRLHKRLNVLGRKINRFMQGVESNHRTVRKNGVLLPHPVSRIAHRVTKPTTYAL